MALDKETEERIEQPVSEQAERETRLTPAEAVDQMRIRAPERANRKLRALFERVNADKTLKGWWHVANVNATVRMEINDHSWVHIQIVTNIALKLLRQLTKHGVEPSVVRDFGMTNDDAEIVVVLGALTHDVGMSIHREGHEEFSLFLVEPEIRRLLDMAQGRSRIPFEKGRVSMHSLSAAAVDEVEIKDGEEKPIRIEILMNNSSGLYQVDGLLKAKLRGSGLEPYVEVIAHIDTEAEKRFVSEYRLET